MNCQFPGDGSYWQFVQLNF